MISRVRVPKLKRPDTVFRLAKNESEVAQANKLVCESYLQSGLWENDEGFKANKHLHSKNRLVFVAVNDSNVVATASVVKDDPRLGLPSDKFRRDLIDQQRAAGELLGEVTALAVAKDQSDQRALVLFLFRFVIQYCFYYSTIERFIAVVMPKHAGFYESVIRFTRLSDPEPYGYVRFPVQMLTLHLLEAHLLLQHHYEKDPAEKDNFYRFFMVDYDRNMHFPELGSMRRPRQINWAAQALVRQLPMAG